MLLNMPLLYMAAVALALLAMGCIAGGPPALPPGSIPEPGGGPRPFPGCGIELDPIGPDPIGPPPTGTPTGGATEPSMRLVVAVSCSPPSSP